MKNPKLAIVIHAEEEFDWDAGFYRSNTSVTHDQELITLIDTIIGLGGKVTLAMDYPFITSEGGKRVVNKYKEQEGETIEFATHLHPWVNPPYEDENDQVEAEFSYPGNLSRYFEYQKLKVLTEKIEKVTGTRPVTYLAGRYGIGENTATILNELGYKVDLSVSAYCDFTHQEGPDFSHCTNACSIKNQITSVPHTCSILSAVPFVTNYLNSNPERFTQFQKHRITSLVSKVLRIKRHRLSPEGFTFSEMKRVTETQISVGQPVLVMSFHSPSAKLGLTPYVNSKAEAKEFVNNLSAYLTWFIEEYKGEPLISKKLYQVNEQG